VGLILVVALLCWMIWIVVVGLVPGRGIHPRLVLANQTLQLEQRWRMFGNTDLTSQGWFVVIGRLADGSQVDVFRGPPGEPVSFDRPDDFASRFPTHTWRKLYSLLIRESYAVFRSHYADYKCREWNDRGEPGPRLDSVELVYMKRKAVDPDVPVNVERVSLVRRPCP